jgi:hypothetical protein
MNFSYSQRLLAIFWGALAAVQCCHSFPCTELLQVSIRQNLQPPLNHFGSVSELPTVTSPVSESLPRSTTKSYTLLSISATSSSSSSHPSAPPKTDKPQVVVAQQGKRRIRPVALKHERDFFRQAARLESMDSYLLVSTLTASMSFGALLGFQPLVDVVTTTTTTVATQSSLALRMWGYQAVCSIIPVIAGFSALFGLYATIIFSLTVLYGKSTFSCVYCGRNENEKEVT